MQELLYCVCATFFNSWPYCRQRKTGNFLPWSGSTGKDQNVSIYQPLLNHKLFA